MQKTISLNFSYPFLYQWRHRQNVSMLSNLDFDSIDVLNQCFDQEKILKEVKNINGSFAVVVNHEDFLLAAVDRIRSFPLFYSVTQNEIIISDNLSKIEYTSLDKNSINYFEENSCTHGRDTLLANWKQLQPGEFLYYEKENDKFSVAQYFSFVPQPQEISLHPKKMREIYLEVFQDILKKIGDRPIVVALSGGYDSRSVISVLQLLKRKNVFAYTYGTQSSPEKLIASQIAQAFNLDWHFVAYNDELLKLFGGEKWEKLEAQNHNFSSLPGEQDFFALHYLQGKNLLPKNAVVLSGFLGDCLGGSMFRSGEVRGNKLQVQNEQLSNFECKYIINSLRTYEYFGLEWVAVLMDKRILESWLQVPLEERCFKNGYNNFLRNEFFIPLGIDFLKEDHFYDGRWFINFLKRVLPGKLIDFMKHKKATKAMDLNNSNFLNSLLSAQLQKKQPSPKFNITYARFLIEKLEKKSIKI